MVTRLNGQFTNYQTEYRLCRTHIYVAILMLREYLDRVAQQLGAALHENTEKVRHIENM